MVEKHTRCCLPQKHSAKRRKNKGAACFAALERQRGRRAGGEGTPLPTTQVSYAFFSRKLSSVGSRFSFTIHHPPPPRPISKTRILRWR